MPAPASAQTVLPQPCGSHAPPGAGPWEGSEATGGASGSAACCEPPHAAATSTKVKLRKSLVMAPTLPRSLRTRRPPSLRSDGDTGVRSNTSHCTDSCAANDVDARVIAHLPEARAVQILAAEEPMVAAFS